MAKNTVEETRMCIHCGIEPRIPKQSDCRKCHNDENRRRYYSPTRKLSDAFLGVAPRK